MNHERLDKLVVRASMLGYNGTLSVTYKGAGNRGTLPWTASLAQLNAQGVSVEDAIGGLESVLSAEHERRVKATTAELDRLKAV